MRAYPLSDGARLEERDIDTAAAGNARPRRLWPDATTLWVSDEQDGKLYAYAVPGLRVVSVTAVADATLSLLSMTDIDVGTFAAATRSYAVRIAHDMLTAMDGVGAMGTHRW